MEETEENADITVIEKKTKHGAGKFLLNGWSRSTDLICFMSDSRFSLCQDDQAGHCSNI